MDNKVRIMQEGGGKLGQIRDRILSEAKVGVATIELDRLAEKLIKEAGGKPSFKMVDGYSWSTCICVNDCIVHGIPNDYKIKKNDTVTVDVGMVYKGFHTDTASTIVIAENRQDRFLAVGRQALNDAIAQARLGNKIGHISRTMQQIVEAAGYNVARTLVGHGIGRKLHENPQIPCFVDGKIKIEQTPPLKERQTLAVEVIYMEGNPELEFDENDNWTIRTKDGSRSGMFEHTIAVTSGEALVVT